MTTFYFNTGVRVFVMEHGDMGKPKYYAPTDKIINGVRHIPFDCEDVPEGYKFDFASPYDNVPTHGDVIIRKMNNTTMRSDYAYFSR